MDAVHIIGFDLARQYFRLMARTQTAPLRFVGSCDVLRFCPSFKGCRLASVAMEAWRPTFQRSSEVTSRLYGALITVRQKFPSSPSPVRQYFKRD